MFWQKIAVNFCLQPEKQAQKQGGSKFPLSTKNQTLAGTIAWQVFSFVRVDNN